MSISSWLPCRLARPHKGQSRPLPSRKAHRCGKRLAFEHLEDRALLSNWSAASVSDLIADIKAANLAGGSNTIALVAGKSFTLTAVDNTTNGANGLPVIAAKNNLTILGNGDTIARNTASGTPNFRLFDVALGASLTLANVTLQGGVAAGTGVAAEGGAIFNQGTLDLNGVTVQNNIARAAALSRSSESAAGGGIYSSGSLTLEAGTLINGNQVLGARGGEIPGTVPVGLKGGSGLGGGVYVATGTATLTNVTLSSNYAQGGPGGGTLNPGAGGNGYGAGVYVAGGTATLADVALSSNSARGGSGSCGGTAYGGGLHVAGGTVILTSDSLSSNAAVGGQAYNRGHWGNAYGGGVSVMSGTVTLASDTLSSNSAIGGRGYSGLGGTGGGGSGFGGALYAGGGTVTLRNDTMSGNSARGGFGGLGKGGGLYLGSAAYAYLDAFTVSHTTGNTPDDVYGPYTMIA
jgi:hypothetical protein